MYVLLLLAVLFPASLRSLAVGPVQEEAVDWETLDVRALRELKKDLKDEDHEKRSEALEQAAALTAEHPESPSTAVGRVLVAALEDDDYGVRRKALRLLLTGQHPKELVDGLPKAGKRARKELDKYIKDLDEMSRETYSKSRKRKTDLAAFRNLMALPALGPGEEKAWKDWLEANGGSFLARAEPLTEPVVAELVSEKEPELPGLEGSR